jgi:nitroreductase
MDVYQTILARKSVRAFKNREVSDEIITRLLEAARHAPSANNFQEWRFVVVRNPVTRNKISAAACRQKFVATAPVILACCAVTDNHVMTCGQVIR